MTSPTMSIPPAGSQCRQRTDAAKIEVDDKSCTSFQLSHDGAGHDKQALAVKEEVATSDEPRLSPVTATPAEPAQASLRDTSGASLRATPQASRRATPHVMI